MIWQLLNKISITIIKIYVLRISNLQVREAEFVDLFDAKGKELLLAVAI